MGNFGKRLLIILLSVAAVVTLTLVGNTYQQAEKIHRISNSSDVVIEGNYNGIKYSITRRDLLDQMLESSALTNVETYFLSKYLLADVISAIDLNNQNHKALYDAKKNYLIYGTTDAKTIQKYVEAGKDTEAIKTYNDSMNLLGYTEEEDRDNYIKYLLARDLYAKSLLLNGIEVGGKTYLKEDDLKEEFAEGYSDTKAIVIKFLSSNDYSTFIDQWNIDHDYKLTTVSSALRVYIGEGVDAAGETGKYRPGKDINDTYIVDDSLKGVATKYDTTVYTITDGVLSSDTVNESKYIPYANVLLSNSKFVYVKVVESGATTLEGFVSNSSSLSTLTSPSSSSKIKLLSWNDTYKNWRYGDVLAYSSDNSKWEVKTVEEGNKTIDTLMANYDKKDTYSSSNTALINAEQYLKLYTEFYNYLYKFNLKNDLNTTVSVSDCKGSLTDDEFNAKLKELGYVYLNGEIRKYVGNDSYVVDTETVGNEVVAKSLYGEPIYKTYGSSKTKLPNVKVETNSETGEVVLDDDGNIKKILDDDGKEQSLAVAIDSENVTFSKANTISINKAQLYSIYCSIVGVDSINYNYEDSIDGLDSSSNRLAVIKELFENVSTLEYYKVAKSISSGTPYYMIYKLTNSALDEEVNTDSQEYKDFYTEKLNEILSDSNFVNMAIAELFKNAGLKFNDPFIASDYDETITYVSSDDDEDNANEYGVEDTDGYYKNGAYSASVIAKLTKKVSYKIDNVDGITVETSVDKVTLKADDLYNYDIALRYNYLVTQAISEQVLENMEENISFHGKDKNFLTSSNFKMQEYKTMVENMNYYYENGIYSYYYGIEADTFAQLLYSISNVRSYKSYVEKYKLVNTLNTLFTYKTLLGGDLTDTDATGGTLASVTVDNDAFKELLPDDYYSVDIRHIIIEVDADDDDSPDDFDEFYENLPVDSDNDNKKYFDYNGNKVYFEDFLDALYADIIDYIYKDGSLTSSSTTAMSSYCTDYQNSTRDSEDDEFKELYTQMKYLRMRVEYQTITTSSSNEDTVVDAWKVSARRLYDEIKTVSNLSDFPGYKFDNDFTTTVYGKHFLVGIKGSDFDKTSFKFAEEGYNSELTNTNDSITLKQLALYIQNLYYKQLFGSSSKSSEYAAEAGYTDFSYPTFPSSLASSIDSVYGDYLDAIMYSNGTSVSYYVSYVILGSLLDSNNYTNKANINYDFSSLRDMYAEKIFG